MKRAGDWETDTELVGAPRACTVGSVSVVFVAVSSRVKINSGRERNHQKNQVSRQVVVHARQKQALTHVMSGSLGPLQQHREINWG